jgi:hypothetical protein
VLKRQRIAAAQAAKASEHGGESRLREGRQHHREKRRRKPKIAAASVPKGVDKPRRP